MPEALAAPRFCGECGKPVSTKYCKHCGALASDTLPAEARQPAAGAASNQSDVEAIEDDILGKDSVIRVALDFARAPVKTIIRLTDDKTYRKQWQFMVSCTLVVLTFVLVVFPRLFPQASNPHPKGAQILGQANQYISYFIMTPLQYYAARAMGGAPRRLAEYFKLCALSVGYTSLLYIGTLLASLLIGHVLQTEGIQWSPAFAQFVWYILLFVPPAIFITMSHRIFWKFGWLRAIILTIALIAVTNFAVGYFLNGIETSLDLAEAIESVI